VCRLLAASQQRPFAQSLRDRFWRPMGVPLIERASGRIVVLGNVKSQCGVATSDYAALLDVYIDGIMTEQVRMPYDYIVRKYDIYHKYLLKNGDHQLEIKWVNQDPDFRIYLKSYVVYSEFPPEQLDPGAQQNK
ncbi:MAG: hypothetical protein MUC31_06980, partial [Bacteroidales bacterium]|nr:hypothetical protein [Bacteroidales bacterium]